MRKLWSVARKCSTEQPANLRSIACNCSYSFNFAVCPSWFTFSILLLAFLIFSVVFLLAFDYQKDSSSVSPTLEQLSEILLQSNMVLRSRLDIPVRTNSLVFQPWGSLVSFDFIFSMWQKILFNGWLAVYTNLYGEKDILIYTTGSDCVCLFVLYCFNLQLGTTVQNSFILFFAIILI